MKIALGTKSVYKGRMVQHVLSRLDVDPKIAYCDVSSEVADQPMKPGETKLGSCNRAKNALAVHNESEWGCGIEFGYEPEGDDFQCIVYACLMDKMGHIFYGQSSTFLLPRHFKDALLSGKELKDVYFDREKNKKLTNINIEINRYLRKDDMIIEAVRSAFVSYMAYDICAC